MSEKRVSEMTDDEIREMAGAGTLRDEVADMIADWYGRGPIDADRDLAQQIINRVRGSESLSKRH